MPSSIVFPFMGVEWRRRLHHHRRGLACFSLYAFGSVLVVVEGGCSRAGGHKGLGVAAAVRGGCKA